MLESAGGMSKIVGIHEFLGTPLSPRKSGKIPEIIKSLDLWSPLPIYPEA